MSEPESLYGGRGKEDYRQAEWLAQRLRKEWRFDHTAGRWHHWDKVRWAPDDRGLIHSVVAKHAGLSLQKPTPEAIELLKWPAQERALKALATFDDYATNGDDWDSDPYTMGAKNGIIDLRTNSLVPHPTPDMLVTKTTGHNFTPVSGPEEFEATAPNFMRVLNEWMSGDVDMVHFLLFWLGYCLFGITPEQRFLLMTGIGRNGKGALKHAMLKAFGEYSDQLDQNLYMQTKFGSARSSDARTDLLKLKGLRVGFFSEPEGGRFNEELLKAHTGGDRINARALYSNNIQSWDPTHSINFLVNNAPQVEDLGPSMASRVMVIDFRERFDGDRMDKNLYGHAEAKLDKEAAGIMRILVWAASVWYQRWSTTGEGLILPDRVVEQSAAFMARNDLLANWLNERAAFGAAYTQNSQLAYDSYVNWFSLSGEPGEAMSVVRWAQGLNKKGFTKEKTREGIKWSGFRLLNAAERADAGIDDEEEP